MLASALLCNKDTWNVLGFGGIFSSVLDEDLESSRMFRCEL